MSDYVHESCCRQVAELRAKIERLNAELERRERLTINMDLEHRATIKRLTAALDKACEPIETQPKVGASIDYANGFMRGAQSQRMRAWVAKEAATEQEGET